MRNFNVRAKVVGPGVSAAAFMGELMLVADPDGSIDLQGMFVKYIQAETGTRVQIKGLGSGFIENDTGREAEEPMHVYIRSVLSMVSRLGPPCMSLLFLCIVSVVPTSVS